MGLLMILKKDKIQQSISKNIINNFRRKYPKENIICKAPFSALYFHPDGQVGACCLNKDEYYYGIYNQKSIAEIIKSDLRKKHQEYLKSNNLSLGCRVCENSLIAKNYSGLLATIYQKFNTNKKIDRIDFELSYHCNFNCIMCLRDKSYKQSPIYNDNFLDEIKPLLKKIKFANFLGGEPFLIPIYYKIWDYLIKNNRDCMITVQTNGSIYNEKIEKLLNHVNFHVGVSIDSVRNGKFEEIRQNSSLNIVLENVKTFAKYAKSKGSNLQISACPMRINYKDILEIVDFANQNNYLLFFNQVFTPKKLNLRDLDVNSLQNILSIYNEFENKLIDNNIVSKSNKDAFIDLIRLIKLWYDNAVKLRDNSIYLTRVELKKIILNKHINISENEKQNIDKILSDLPDRILCSKQQIDNIKDFDYSTFLKRDISDNQRFNKLLSEVKDFFNL